MVEITPNKLQLHQLLERVADPAGGGIDVFIGTTRNNTSGKPVKKLNFEAYEPMAVKELNKIIACANEQWDILKIAVAHRVGMVEIGEAAVIIAVSAPHRDAAFKACRFIIDELKMSVPIWKKEIFEDGEVWVSAHP